MNFRKWHTLLISVMLFFTAILLRVLPEEENQFLSLLIRHNVNLGCTAHSSQAKVSRNT